MASNNDPTVIPMIERPHCDLPETNTSDPKTLTEEAVLSFHNISYRETVQSGFPLWKKTQVIERLSNIKYVHDLKTMLYGITFLRNPDFLFINELCVYVCGYVCV